MKMAIKNDNFIESFQARRVSLSFLKVFTSHCINRRVAIYLLDYAFLMKFAFFCSTLLESPPLMQCRCRFEEAMLQIF